MYLQTNGDSEVADTAVYDGSQDLIFPSELQVRHISSAQITASLYILYSPNEGRNNTKIKTDRKIHTQA